jgi:hypothetical protein
MLHGKQRSFARVPLAQGRHGPLIYVNLYMCIFYAIAGAGKQQWSAAGQLCCASPEKGQPKSASPGVGGGGILPHILPHLVCVQM